MRSQAIAGLDEELITLDIGFIFRTIRASWRLVLLCCLSFAVLGALYAFLLFQERYQSDSTVLVNASQLPSLAGNATSSGRFFEGLGTEVSPYKNQEEILKSNLVYREVIDRIQKERANFGFPLTVKVLQKRLTGIHIKSTDFMRLSAQANSPERAKTLAQMYVDAYEDVVNQISNSPFSQQKQLYQKQLAIASNDLQKLTQQVKTYQETNEIVDINAESQSKVNTEAQLNSEINDAKATLAEKNAQIIELRRQLQLGHDDIVNAIQSVARGQDGALVEMESKLHDLQRDYNAKALIYAPTNPDMEALQKQITTLQSQIGEQQEASVGQSRAKKKSQFKDSVRVSLVQQLATLQSDASALMQKINKLTVQTGQLDETLRGLPQKQLEYARLQLEKKNKEDIVNRLRDKVTEAQIQAAASQNKIIMMDPPNTPGKALFPTRLDVILFSAMLGLFVSLLGILIRTKMKQGKTLIPYIEGELDLPVLSVIPWLESQDWDAHQKLTGLDVLNSQANPEVIKAYQEFAIQMKSMRHQQSVNSLVFSSVSQGTDKPRILANLAYCLAECSENVILIDANLKSPELQDVFGHQLDYERGLIETINSLSEQLFIKKEMDEEHLMKVVAPALLMTGIHPRLHYINAGVLMENTFGFINSEGFSALISVLKQHYDWVLLDAPPFLKAQDAAVLLNHTDGLVLLVEHEAEKEALYSVAQKVEKLQSKVIGCVMRE